MKKSVILLIALLIVLSSAIYLGSVRNNLYLNRIFLILPAVLLSLSMNLVARLHNNYLVFKKKEIEYVYYPLMSYEKEEESVYQSFLRKVVWIFIPLSYLSLYLADFDKVGSYIKYLIPVVALIVFLSNLIFDRKFLVSSSS
jgi:hypothetical protein